MADIRLIVTDLDGTLIGKANEFPIYTAFREKINELRKKNNTMWAVCTGRSFRSFQAFFAPMRMMSIVPDFIIVNHAHIYSLIHLKYIPYLFWDLQINFLIRANQWNDRKIINDCYKNIRRSFLGVKIIRKRKDRLWLAFSSEKSASIAADLMREKIKDCERLKVFEYIREVDLMSIPFAKGLAVMELARHLAVEPENILAIGNGYNDISMFDSNIAKLAGCPSNSEAEVMAAVNKAGGHIAGKQLLAGVMEILDAHLTDTVCSELPEGWDAPSKGYSTRPKGSSSRSRRHRRSAVGVWVFVGAVYATLLVFANFGLVPFSRIIIKPYRLLLSLLEKIVGAFGGV